MRMVIEARLVDDAWAGAPIPLGAIERHGACNDSLGLSAA